MNYFLSELSLSPLVETIGVGVGVEEDIFCLGILQLTGAYPCLKKVTI